MSRFPDAKSLTLNDFTPDDVTVTISLYNKENSIERAVLSILNQKKSPKEVIVVDDGSSDKGAQIVQQLCEDYPEITYIHQENSGVSVARNRGVQEAKTKLVCLLDADDVWEPNYIENLMELTATAPEADFYTLAYRMSSEHGWLKPEVDLPAEFIGTVHDPIRRYSRGYGLIHTSAICFKKDFFQITGGFPEGVNFGEDLYLWLQSCVSGTLAFSNKISVTLYKEPVNSVNRRKLHPYHVKFFTEHLSDYTKDEQAALKEFLIKNIFIQWAAARLEGNRWQQKTLQQYCLKLSKTKGLILLAAGLFPAEFFRHLKNRRTEKRLIKKNV